MVASLYSTDEEHKSIWVYLEQDSGNLERVSLELLGHARALADKMNWDLATIGLAAEGEALAEQAITQGADRAWLIENPLLKYFTIEAYTQALFQALMLAIEATYARYMALQKKYEEETGQRYVPGVNAYESCIRRLSTGDNLFRSEWEHSYRGKQHRFAVGCRTQHQDHSRVRC